MRMGIEAKIYELEEDEIETFAIATLKESKYCVPDSIKKLVNF